MEIYIPSSIKVYEGIINGGKYEFKHEIKPYNKQALSSENH